MVDAARRTNRATTPAVRASSAAAGTRGVGRIVNVSITQQLGAQALPLFERSLEDADFWRHIEQTLSRSRQQRDRFRIIIKPDLDFFSPTVPEGTDPALVEHLIEMLHERGFRNVAVGDGRNI